LADFKENGKTKTFLLTETGLQKIDLGEKMLDFTNEVDTNLIN